MTQLLKHGFFARDTDIVARELLGATIVRTVGKKTMTAKIVETEAYFGINDPASHASRGMTPRNEVMFGAPGHAYVYLNYGVHWLLNFVTESHGIPGAVLIRAVEPIDGMALMKKNRGGNIKRDVDLTNGPGKLTRAMMIDKRFNGHDLTKPPLTVFTSAGGDFKVVASGRIGISVAKEKPLRYYIDGNAHISRI